MLISVDDRALCMVLFQALVQLFPQYFFIPLPPPVDTLTGYTYKVRSKRTSRLSRSMPERYSRLYASPPINRLHQGEVVLFARRKMDRSSISDRLWAEVAFSRNESSALGHVLIDTFTQFCKCSPLVNEKPASH